MSTKFSSRKEGDLLIIETSGAIKEKGWIELTKQLYGEITKHECTRIIINHLKLEFPTDLLEYVDLEKFYAENFPSQIRLLKLAVVVHPKYKEIGDFWETYCHNRGFYYKAFTSMEDARTHIRQLK